MNTDSSAATLSAAPFHDDVWEDLLNYIEEKRVIPIVGPELLKVETETGSTSIRPRWLSRSS